MIVAQSDGAVSTARRTVDSETQKDVRVSEYVPCTCDLERVFPFLLRQCYATFDAAEVGDVGGAV
jgi:hypothetical protein